MEIWFPCLVHEISEQLRVGTVSQIQWTDCRVVTAVLHTAVVVANQFWCKVDLLMCPSDDLPKHFSTPIVIDYRVNSVAQRLSSGDLICCPSAMNIMSLQTELAVAQGNAARNASELEAARAEQQTLLRSKKMAKEALEGEVVQLQRASANLVASKTAMQDQICKLEQDKCELFAQVRIHRLLQGCWWQLWQPRRRHAKRCPIGRQQSSEMVHHESEALISHCLFRKHRR